MAVGLIQTGKALIDRFSGKKTGGGIDPVSNALGQLTQAMNRGFTMLAGKIDAVPERVIGQMRDYNEERAIGLMYLFSANPLPTMKPNLYLTEKKNLLNEYESKISKIEELTLQPVLDQRKKILSSYEYRVIEKIKKEAGNLKETIEELREILRIECNLSAVTIWLRAYFNGEVTELMLENCEKMPDTIETAKINTMIDEKKKKIIADIINRMYTF
jgi:hypothetical protein